MALFVALSIIPGLIALPFLLIAIVGLLPVGIIGGLYFWIDNKAIENQYNDGYPWQPKL